MPDIHVLLGPERQVVHVYIWHIQWCGNSKSCRTLFDISNECPVKLKLNCIQIYAMYVEQHKSGENRSKCPVVGSHP